jgi:hypothetical protein
VKKAVVDSPQARGVLNKSFRMARQTFLEALFDDGNCILATSPSRCYLKMDIEALKTTRYSDVDLRLALPGEKRPPGYFNVSIIPNVLGAYAYLSGDEGTKPHVITFTRGDDVYFVGKLLDAGAHIEVRVSKEFGAFPYQTPSRWSNGIHTGIVKKAFEISDGPLLDEKMKILRSAPLSNVVWVRACSVDDMIRMGL